MRRAPCAVLIVLALWAGCHGCAHVVSTDEEVRVTAGPNSTVHVCRHASVEGRPRVGKAVSDSQVMECVRVEAGGLTEGLLDFLGGAVLGWTAP